LVGRRSVAVVFGIALAVLAAPAAAAEQVLPAEPAAPGSADPASVPEAQTVAQSEGVSHLPSPESLPPGTTQTPPQRRTLGYLRDIWQAVRTEDVTMGDALLLLAQRPMDSVAPGTAPQQRPMTVPPPAEDPAVPPAPAPAP
jgi:resuscitation-promoting factor RpfA